MDAKWVWFWIIMALLLPVWIIVLYVCVDKLIETIRNNRTSKHHFGIDESWFKIDPQKQKEVDEMIRDYKRRRKVE